MIEIWGKIPGGLIFIVLVVSMVIICVVSIVAWRLWRLGVVIVVVVVVIVVVIIVISPGHHWVHVALNPFETVSKSIIITVGVTLVVVWFGVLFANIKACKDIPMFFPRAVVPALVFTGAGLIIGVIEFTLVRVASLFWAWESLIPARMSIGTIRRVAFWICTARRANLPPPAGRARPDAGGSRINSAPRGPRWSAAQTPRPRHTG